MTTVNVWVTGGDAQPRRIGRIALEGGQVVGYVADEDSEADQRVLEAILEQPAAGMLDGEPAIASADEDPEAFLELLPQQYRGRISCEAEDEDEDDVDAD